MSLFHEDSNFSTFSTMCLIPTFKNILKNQFLLTSDKFNIKIACKSPIYLFFLQEQS